MGHGLGEDQGKNGRGDDHDNANGESHDAPLLGPPPSPPPPPPMTHVEMMAEMLAARHESARALEMLAQAIGDFARGGPGGNGGNGGCCPRSQEALFVSGLLGDTPAHVHTDC